METIRAGLILLTAYAPNDAEMLYKRMEEKLVTAKTVNCVFEFRQSIGKDVIMNLEGSMLLADGNRMRLELKDRDVKDVPFWNVIVSDGKDSLVIDKNHHEPVQDAPDWKNSETIIGLARAGAFLPFMVMEDTGAKDNKERYGISEFQLGEKEKFDDREVQRIEYQLAPKGTHGHTTVVIWIDQKAGLPVRREILSKTDAGTVTTREDYKKFVVDEKIDAKEFDLNQ